MSDAFHSCRTLGIFATLFLFVMKAGMAQVVADPDATVQGLAGAGAVRVNQALLTAASPRAFAHFGASYAMGDDVLLVGEDSTAAPAAGTVWVFARSGSAWKLETRLQASDPQPGDQFGFHLALTGNRVEIAARNAGYIFERNSGSWTLVETSAANHRIAFDSIPDRVMGAPPLPLNATASSGLPVSLESATPGVCTVSGSRVAVLHEGTCSIRAAQSGDRRFNTAVPVERTFNVSTTAPVIAVNGGDVAGLIAAITTINSAGAGFIQLFPNGIYPVSAPSDWWYGPNAFPAIQSNLYIEGNGATIVRAAGSPNFRFFYVAGGFSTLPQGTLTLHNLTLQGGLAQGGRGGNGSSTGGGGAGMGGVAFNQGQLSLVDVQLSQNAAQGGAGGLVICGGAGGGGGMGGNGGDGCSNDPIHAYDYVGAGGGFRSSGGSGGFQEAGGGGFQGSEGGSNAHGGSSTFGGNGGNGNSNVTPGGGGGYSPGENGGSPNGAIGGGNGGAPVPNATGPSGGGGGAFGGGGEGTYPPGGGGGVGGGGGSSEYNDAGSGGFGGGGGGGSHAASGGFGGGAGNFYGHFGSVGGSGHGGAIFNHNGATALVRTTATTNTALGGAAGNTADSSGGGPIGGSPGSGLGGVLFNLNGNVTIEDSSLAGSGGNSAPQGGNSVYVMSTNQGIVAAGQIPAATLTQSSNTLTGTDLVTNQADGTVTSTSASLPEVTVQPAVYAFPATPLNGTSAPLAITVSNNGSTGLTISSIQVLGSFSLQNTCASIAAQSSCTLNVVFQPASTAIAYGAVILNDNAPEGVQAVILSGAGGQAQTISFGPLSNQSLSAASISVSATASSGLSVTFASMTPPVCTVSGSTVTLRISGTCTIQASQAGNTTYAATVNNQSFQVIALAQTISFPAIANQLLTNPSIGLSATATSGLAVSFVSLTTAVCTVSGTTATLLSPDTCTIQAIQPGNTTYSAAAPVNQSFLVSQASQTITFAAIPDRALIAPPLPLKPTASSRLPVVLASTTPAVCSITGSSLTVISLGSCSLTADQPGSNAYLAAPQVVQTFNVVNPQTTVVANGDVAGLIAAITTVNTAGAGFIQLATGGAYSISAPSDWWYGPDAFPAIQSNLYIEGNGATISRATGSPNFRFFYVSGGFDGIAAGTLTLHDLTLQGGLAQGGSGGPSNNPGGGGAGMGGVAFNQGQLNLVDVQLIQNTALGGAGGTASCSGHGGGGGGMGGNGGSACTGNTYIVPGSGGGFRYAGGNGQGFSTFGRGGGFVANEGGYTGGGGASSFGGNGGGGGLNLTGGGGGGFSVGENGGTPGGAPGGGNGGSGPSGCCSTGGGGGAFGGGGAGYASSGGGGGVGGGGGGSPYNSGGSGGFGGGAGGGQQGSGNAGFGGGVSGVGGSGMGAAVFNHTGSLALVRTTATSNAATGGTAGAGSAGAGFGGVVFDLNGSVVIEDSSVAGGNGNTADAGNANSVYVESSNQGNTANGQTPAAVLVQQQSGTLLSATDLVTNPVNGITTSNTASLPEVTVQPLSGTLGAAVNGTSLPLAITIANNGAATLTFNSIQVTGQFSLQNTCAPIAPQSSCTLNVVFSPTSANAASGIVILNDNAPEGTQAVFLSGVILQTQTITFAALADQTFGAAPFTVSATASSGLPVSFASTTTSVCTVSGVTVTLVAAGTCTIQASQAGNATYAPAATVSQSFTVAQAAATVTLGALTQTYTGGPLTPTETTTPPGLAIVWTGAPQTNAGTYMVTATINDPNYQGSASSTFVITQATATVSLGALTQTYTGSPLTPTATTTPAGLALVWTGAPQTTVGTYAVTATINDPNYRGSASGTFVITQATATVSLGNLTQAYTGAALKPTVTTTPSGLATVLTGAPQTNPGSYPVTATVNDPNYKGSASGTFVITKKPATVTLTNLMQTYTGNPLSPGATTSPAGLTIIWSGAPQTNAGSYSVTATVSNPNYQGSASGTFVINKATISLSIGSTTQTFTGSPLLPTTNAPNGWTVSWTGAPQTNAGQYSVTATATLAAGNPNYKAASASAIFAILPASTVATIAIIPLYGPGPSATYPEPVACGGKPACQEYSDAVNAVITVTNMKLGSQTALAPVTCNTPQGSVTAPCVNVGAGGITMSIALSPSGTGGTYTGTLSNVPLLYPLGQFSLTAAPASNVNPNFAFSSPGAVVTIVPKDAFVVYSGLTDFTTAGTAKTQNITVSYTVRDPNALASSNPAYQPYAGDITTAKLTLYLTSPTGLFTGTCAANVIAISGDVSPSNGLPTTGTASCVIPNVPVNGTYSLTPSAGAGSSYNPDEGDTGITITNGNDGDSFVYGSGSQSAAYLATPNTGVGKYKAAGLLVPAAGTNVSFVLEGGYTPALQGQAWITIHAPCLTGIAGYTANPGSDGLCVYRIVSDAMNSVTLEPPFEKWSSSAIVQDITRSSPITVATNLQLLMVMDFTDNTAPNSSTLSIEVLDDVNGLWFSNNWTGVKTAISATAPLVQGSFMQFENEPQPEPLTMNVAPAGTGTTTPAPVTTNEIPGSLVVVTAKPNTGYYFVNWTGKVDDPSSSTTTVIMNQAQALTANFAVCSCAPDVSGAITVTRGAYLYNPITHRFAQTVTLLNHSTAAIAGPISLVVDNLSAGAAVFMPTGVTDVREAPAGSPYMNVAAGLGPGQSTTITLQFTDPNKATITYNTRVLAGAGLR